MIARPLCQGQSSEPPLQRARRELQREWRMRAGLEALYERAGADGVVTLTGGVRGWADTLGCSPGWPRKLLAELERRNFVAGVEIYPGEGGLVAEVHLEAPPPVARAADSISDRSEPVTTPATAWQPPTPAIPAPHQDAELAAADSISDRSPPTPPHEVLDHESMQQQQHAHAHDPRVAEAGFLTGLLLREHPSADRALLSAWEADPRVNDCKAAAAALGGFPTATLGAWQTDLAAAEDRPTTEWPVGLVLATWARGERVTPRRSAVVERPSFTPPKPRAAPEPPLAPPPPRSAAPPEPPPRVLPAEREQMRRLQLALGVVREQFTSKDLMDWGLNRAAVADVAGGAAVITLPGFARLPPPSPLLSLFRRACRDALQVQRVEIVDPAAYAAAAD